MNVANMTNSSDIKLYFNIAVFVLILLINIWSSESASIKNNVTYSQYSSYGYLGFEEYRDPNQDDFFKWLTTLNYCTNGKVCAIANEMTCENGKNKSIISNEINQASLVLQTHRGSSEFATYVITSTGDFVTLAQENEAVDVVLYNVDGAKTFPDNKIIFTSDNALQQEVIDVLKLKCLPFYKANTFTITNNTRGSFAFCLDLTTAYNSSKYLPQAGKTLPCRVFLIQIATMITEMELHNRIFKKVIQDTKNDFINQFEDYLNNEVEECFQNSTAAAAEFCKSKTTATTGAKFIECIEAVELDACMDFNSIYDDTFNRLFYYGNTTNYNLTNSSSLSFGNQLTQNLMQSVGIGTTLSLFGGYFGYKVNSKNDCTTGILEATGKCALSAGLALGLGTAGLEGFTYFQATAQQSVLYDALCHQNSTAEECVNQTLANRFAPQSFTKHIGATQANIGILTTIFTTTNLAGCIVGTIKNIATCKYSSKKAKEEQEERDITSLEEERENGDRTSLPSRPGNPEPDPEPLTSRATVAFPNPLKSLKKIVGKIQSKFEEKYETTTSQSEDYGQPSMPASERMAIQSRLRQQRAQQIRAQREYQHRLHEQQLREREQLNRQRQQQQHEESDNYENPDEVLEAPPETIPLDPPVPVQFPFSTRLVTELFTKSLPAAVVKDQPLQDVLHKSFSGVDTQVRASFQHLNKINEPEVQSEIDSLRDEYGSEVRPEGPGLMNENPEDIAAGEVGTPFEPLIVT